MIEGIIGRKIGMTRVFNPDGVVESVTAIEAGPCAVTQVKTVAKEGYSAVQMGFGEAKRLSSPQRGQVKDYGQFKYLREFRVDDDSIEVGEKIDAGLFKAGDLIDVTGISKGKGFAGVVKRHHFAGGPKTHGQSDRHRHAGSIGAGSSPGRVLKGLRMAGHMGNRKTTVTRLKVYGSDPERNLLLVKGAVPGGKNGLLILKKTSREK
ncbi:50S ribosomal protein L3 [Chloroflexota bacterium]